MPSFDVIVVGGGIVGASISFRLAQERLRVALLDRSQPGREASWAAAGILSPVPDSPASIPLVPFGRASLLLYPEFIAEVEELSGESAAYRAEGTIELLFSAEAERELSTMIAVHHGLGLPTEPLPVDEARQIEPAISREARAAALLPYEASVDNRALTKAAVAAALTSGVAIYPGSEVVRIHTEANRCTGVVTDAGETFLAANVVLAAGAFSSRIEGMHAPLPSRPIRGQMVALSNTDVPLTCVIRSDRGYIVPRNDGLPQRVVTGSTLEDVGFEKRVTPRGLEQILSCAQELAPSLANAEIVETWCGLRPDTPDHLPLLGPGEWDGLIVATGHYRNGILLTPITAKLVSEWIVQQNVSMDWDIFDPLRFVKAASAKPQ